MRRSRLVAFGGGAPAPSGGRHVVKRRSPRKVGLLGSIFTWRAMLMLPSVDRVIHSASSFVQGWSPTTHKGVHATRKATAHKRGALGINRKSRSS